MAEGGSERGKSDARYRQGKKNEKEANKEGISRGTKP